MTEPTNAASSDTTSSSGDNISLMSGLKRKSSDDDSIFGASEGEEESNLLEKRFRTIEPLPPNVEICAAEFTYEASSRNARTLIVLCRGIVDVEEDGKKQQQLIDITIPPWSEVIPKKSISPTNAEYVTEICRRWHKFAGIPTDF